MDLQGHFEAIRSAVRAAENDGFWIYAEDDTIRIQPAWEHGQEPVESMELEV